MLGSFADPQKKKPTRSPHYVICMHPIGLHIQGLQNLKIMESSPH